MFDIAKPWIGVQHRPLSSFVTAARGADAKLVMVDGEVVYREGKLSHVAEPMRVIAEAEKIAREALAKAGLSGKLEGAWRG